MSDVGRLAFRSLAFDAKGELERDRRNCSRLFGFVRHLVTSRGRVDRGQQRESGQHEADFQGVLFYSHKLFDRCRFLSLSGGSRRNGYYSPVPTTEAWRGYKACGTTMDLRVSEGGRQTTRAGPNSGEGQARITYGQRERMPPPGCGRLSVDFQGHLQPGLDRRAHHHPDQVKKLQAA